jgi:hypothetical protein
VLADRDRTRSVDVALGGIEIMARGSRGVRKVESVERSTTKTKVRTRRRRRGGEGKIVMIEGEMMEEDGRREMKMNERNVRVKAYE